MTRDDPSAGAAEAGGTVQNIEIKCPLPDRDRIAQRLAEIDAEEHWVRTQRDTFFDVPSGWLKIREENGRTEVISYQRSTVADAPRPSDYDVVEVESGPLWQRVLGRVLALGGVIEKERALWIYRHTRIHLDRVVGLGDFLELETVVDGITSQAAAAESNHLIEELGLDRASFIGVPYRDLLRQGS
ncbi:MAG: class IV adenylate cyclase [Planctomycetota bacterium]